MRQKTRFPSLYVAHNTRGLGRGNSVLHFVEFHYFRGTPHIIRCAPFPDVSSRPAPCGDADRQR
jgi:hypothetical protein